jgi:hypothetical protein
MFLIKTKTTVIETELDEDRFDLVPPETHYLSSRYIIKIPVSDKHLKDRWELRKHAAKLLENSLGDEVQVTKLKLKKPHALHKRVARLRGRTPYARAYVTVKF